MIALRHNASNCIRVRVDGSLRLAVALVCISRSCFCCVIAFIGLVLHQEFAQVKTPYNVKMIPTSPRELAWLLAGVVYPADADDSPEIFVEDLNEAMTMDLTAAQDRYVNARLLATRFIQKLLSKVNKLLF